MNEDTINSSVPVKRVSLQVSTEDKTYWLTNRPVNVRVDNLESYLEQNADTIQNCMYDPDGILIGFTRDQSNVSYCVFLSTVYLRQQPVYINQIIED